MHPFVNPFRGIIFWWSAKCGCTTVKSIMIESMVFDLVSGRAPSDSASVAEAVKSILVRRKRSGVGDLYGAVSDALSELQIDSLHAPACGIYAKVSLVRANMFRNFLFVRNPYRRFVSGVMDKHINGSMSGQFRPESFLDAARNIGSLDCHHFLPQTSGAYLPSLSYERVFDIESIDYGYLSELLGIEVRPRSHHKDMRFSLECVPGLASAPYDEIADMKARGEMPRHDCFYDEESRELVGRYYEGDFSLMRRWLNPEVS